MLRPNIIYTFSMKIFGDGSPHIESVVLKLPVLNP